jgi:hypothetical protein
MEKQRRASKLDPDLVRAPGQLRAGPETAAALSGRPHQAIAELEHAFGPYKGFSRIVGMPERDPQHPNDLGSDPVQLGIRNVHREISLALQT